jgi:hypothetical protein
MDTLERLMAIPTSLQRTSRTAKDVAVRRKPYFETIAPGLALGYRRNRRGGVWVVRATDGRGKHWTDTFAVADDNELANGETVLTYSQALKRAPTLARGTSSDTSGSDRPITVEAAIDAYERELIARGRSKFNATMIRGHMKGTPLFTTSVAMLRQQGLADVRNGLVASGLQPSSANRIGKCLKAALTLAADRDQRITNRAEWTKGWAMLANSLVANNIVLPEAVVQAIVAKAYEVDHALGLTFHTLAATGARYSQIMRLRIRDLQGDRTEPRLMMPGGMKGNNPQLRYEPVPVTAHLAQKLRALAAGRSTNDLLFQPIVKLHERFYEVAKMVGDVDPEASPYSFRHSNITRLLLAGKAITLVAKLHDTSVEKIESNYADKIAGHGDATIRETLLDFGTTTAA